MPLHTEHSQDESSGHNHKETEQSQCRASRQTGSISERRGHQSSLLPSSTFSGLARPSTPQERPQRQQQEPVVEIERVSLQPRLVFFTDRSGNRRVRRRRERSLSPQQEISAIWRPSGLPVPYLSCENSAEGEKSGEEREIKGVCGGEETKRRVDGGRVSSPSAGGPLGGTVSLRRDENQARRALFGDWALVIGEDDSEDEAEDTFVQMPEGGDWRYM